MFTKRFVDSTASGVCDCSNDPKLVNQQYKFRTLGEIVALARVTNEKPLPTRAGVYIGDNTIPRDNFDRIDARSSVMDSYDKAEIDLGKAENDLKQHNELQQRIKFEESVKAKYSSKE